MRAVAYFIIISSFVAPVGAQDLHAVWPELSVSCHCFVYFPQLSPALVLSWHAYLMHFSLLCRTRTVNFTDVIFLSLPKSTSFFSVYIETMLLVVWPKYSRTSRKYSANPGHALQTLPKKLTHVGRHGNNYISLGWVVGEGTREFVTIPPRTITPRVKGT